jgi:hypothetical protein
VFAEVDQALGFCVAEGLVSRQVGGIVDQAAGGMNDRSPILSKPGHK